jgi:hypothetical protein
MTDFPWFFIHNDGPAGLPTDPSQRLRSASSLDSDGPLYHEPGNKLYFHTGEQYPGIWTYTHVPADATRWWEATVSSTRHGNTTGAYDQLLAGVRTASALLANGWANPASLRPITLVDLPEQHDYAGGAVVDLSY